MGDAVLRGSCLCGAIRYEIDGELGRIDFCHCSMCRKAQGGAFATTAPVDAGRFRIVAGQEQLRAYRSSPNKERCFCGNCGSPIISRLLEPGAGVRVRVGTLDTRIAARPTAHIFVGSKAHWEEIADRLPQYQELEPGR